MMNRPVLPFCVAGIYTRAYSGLPPTVCSMWKSYLYQVQKCEITLVHDPICCRYFILSYSESQLPAIMGGVLAFVDREAQSEGIQGLSQLCMRKVSRWRVNRLLHRLYILSIHRVFCAPTFFGIS